MYRGYLSSVEAIKRPKLLTLTLRNVERLQGQAQRLRRCFTRLCRRKRWKDLIRGGLQTVEVTNQGKGWHVHLHVLVDSAFLPWDKLRADWREITGDSFIVDVREAGSVGEGLKYCLKYLGKPPKLQGKGERVTDGELEGRREEYRAAMKGVRLVQPFGTLYGELVMVLPDVICRECGGHAWLVWEFELMPEFYRWQKEKWAEKARSEKGT